MDLLDQKWLSSNSRSNLPPKSSVFSRFFFKAHLLSEQNKSWVFPRRIPRVCTRELREPLGRAPRIHGVVRPQGISVRRELGFCKLRALTSQFFSPKKWTVRRENPQHEPVSGTRCLYDQKTLSCGGRRAENRGRASNLEKEKFKDNKCPFVTTLKVWAERNVLRRRKAVATRSESAKDVSQQGRVQMCFSLFAFFNFASIIATRWVFAV